eukprot:gene11997-15092_t
MARRQAPAVRSAISSGQPAPTSMENDSNKLTGPVELPDGMSDVTSLLEAFAEVPVISKVQVRGGSTDNQPLWVTTFMAQRNVPANTLRKYSVHTCISPGAPPCTSMPMELPNALLFAPSPSAAHQLVVKAGGEEASASALMQLWSNTDNRLLSELLIPKGLHGPLINDGYFASGVAWCKDESAVGYTAEVPVSEKTPAWGGPDSLKDQVGTKSWRGIGPVVEDWGELNTGKRSPAVFVYDVQQKEVVKVPVPETDDETSFGQPVWAPGGSGIVMLYFVPCKRNQSGALEFGTPTGLANSLFVPCKRNQSGALEFGTPTRLAKSANSAPGPVFTP